MKRMILLILSLSVLLSGCAMSTVDDMFQLPKRAQSDSELQLLIDEVMADNVYCAPLSGEHQQTVQMADLNGDGEDEYLLFAKEKTGKRLQIYIFARDAERYVLLQVLQSTGSAFDLVEYIQMDDRPGMELVVGYQVSDQVIRSVSVYGFSGAETKLLLSTNYTKFIAVDLDSDDRSELMILRPGELAAENGIAELYEIENGVLERSNETAMSGPPDKLKRIITGKLHGGAPAVFVGTAIQEDAIITDVYTVVDGTLTNVSFSNESGTSVKTLRNYYVYAADIDDDGEVELPELITMMPIDQGTNVEKQCLVRWYSMTPDGREVDKMYTYHNYADGWFLQLDEALVSRISVIQEDNSYSFYLWDSSHAKPEKVFTVSALTGNDREAQALENGRFVLHRGDSVVYAAYMEPNHSALIKKEDLINGFHLIRQDWKTGEM